MIEFKLDRAILTTVKLDVEFLFLRAIYYRVRTTVESLA